VCRQPIDEIDRRHKSVAPGERRSYIGMAARRQFAGMERVAEVFAGVADAPRMTR